MKKEKLSGEKLDKARERLTPDKSDLEFERAWSAVVERFPEAVLIVKSSAHGNSGSMRWRSTDQTWASGATERYLHIMRSNDHLDQVASRAQRE
jgi:hypothetical protein